MRQKKLRGHKRIWKEIEAWQALQLELDLESLLSRERDYCKIWIHPFSDISLLNSAFPEPKGKTRKLILQALIEIHDAWRSQLDTLDQPYYLKLWLYAPRFSKSQVVCAVGSALDFYDTTFQLSAEQPSVLQLPDAFSWQVAWDEEYYSQADVGEPDDYDTLEDYASENRFLAQRMRVAHRQITSEDQTYYAVKYGRVMLGEAH